MEDNAACVLGERGNVLSEYKQLPTRSHTNKWIREYIIDIALISA
jgi:hypothetical protein